MTPMTEGTERVELFGGRLGTQSVHVWFEWRAGDLLLCSQDIGPALESIYGEDEIETFLTVEAAQLTRLAHALGCADDPAALEAALLDRYRGDSAATSHLRELLAEHTIPYEFFLT